MNLPYEKMIEEKIQPRMESEIDTNTHTKKKSNSTQHLRNNSDEELKNLTKRMQDEIWKEEKYIQLKVNYSIESIAWNFNDTKIAVGCWRECIYIFNLSSSITQIENQKPTITDFTNGNIAWHPSKNKLAYMGFLNLKNCILFYDSEKHMIIDRVFLDEEEKASSQQLNHLLSWHPNQELVVVYNHYKSQIQICDMKKIIKTISTKLTEIADLKWSFKGDKIAFCGKNKLMIWNYEEENLNLTTIEPSKNIIDNVYWLPNDLKFFYKSNSKIKIWNIEDEVEESNFGALSEIQAIDVSSNCNFIGVGNQDKTLTIWDAKNLVELMSRPINEENITVKWSNSCSRLAAKLKKNILIYKFSTNFNLKPIKYEFKNQVKKSIWSPNGEKLLIIFDLESYFKIWDSKTDRFHEESLNSDIKDAEWHGSESVICLLDDGIYFYDRNNSKTYDDEIYPNKNNVHLIRCNQDCMLMLGAGNKKIEIWSINSEDFKVEMEIDAHLRNITDVRWSLKRIGRILSASRDGAIKVWDLDIDRKSADQVLEIKKHMGFVNSAFWDESERNIISFGADQFIRIFDSSNGHQLRTIKTNDDKIKITSWVNVFNERFLIFLQPLEQNFQILDYKTGFLCKRINAFQSEEGKLLPTSYIDSSTDENNEKIIISSEKTVLIFDSSKFMNDFETYEYLYFLMEFLPNQKIIQKEHSNLIERIINCFFFDECPTVFHILSDQKTFHEFEILIEFCSQHKIYPKRIFDKNNMLFERLNKMPLSSIDMFFDYIIKADLPLGNSFSVSYEELKKYLIKNSSKVLKFLESRVKIIEPDQYRLKKSAENYQPPPFLIKNIYEIKKNDFFPEVKDIIFDKKGESSEKPIFKILDIPLLEIGLDFINDVSESNSFDDFCKSSLFISLLDILWSHLVRKEFMMSNTIYAIYILILFSNSIIVLPGYLAEIELYQSPNEGSYWIAFLILNILLIMLLKKMIQAEISEMGRNKAYQSSFWNYIDWINIFLCFSSIIFGIVVLAGGTEQYDWLRIFHSIGFFFSIVRIFDIFRSNKKTCFLIEIVLQVIIDMRIFLFLMALLISAFSFSGKA